MRQVLSLLLVLALLAAGCVEEYTPAASGTPAQTPVVAVSAEKTPVPTPAPEPVAVAYISGITCGVGDRSDAAYHCNGDIRIGRGAYENVQVIAMYPDKNVFRSGTVSLGGDEAVSKPFVIFPDIKYKGQTPAYFVKVDGVFCMVTWSGSTGVARTNTTVPDVVMVS